MKILILGASGMLGHTLFKYFSAKGTYDVLASIRSEDKHTRWGNFAKFNKFIYRADANNLESIENLISEVKPKVIINCIGIIKQHPLAKDSISSITINALFPHRLAQLCKSLGIRLIHFSTDCVFSGKKGNYTEDDFSDADDLYGRTKLLGELHDSHCVTLRTSIIGHELQTKHGLIDWFLNETESVKGYTRAIFSGFPTLEIAHIIANYIIPNDKLSGLYHVSSNPISKYNLLKLVAEQYGHRINIEAYDDFICDRSLDSSKFHAETGYTSPSWEELVASMHKDFLNYERR